MYRKIMKTKLFYFGVSLFFDLQNFGCKLQIHIESVGVSYKLQEYTSSNGHCVRCLFYSMPEVMPENKFISLFSFYLLLYGWGFFSSSSISHYFHGKWATAIAFYRYGEIYSTTKWKLLVHSKCSFVTVDHNSPKCLITMFQYFIRLLPLFRFTLAKIIKRHNFIAGSSLFINSFAKREWHNTTLHEVPI